jgi:hypothetical protein
VLRKASVALASCKWQKLCKEPVVCHAIAKALDLQHHGWALYIDCNLILAGFRFLQWNLGIDQADWEMDFCALTCKGMFTSYEEKQTLLEAAYKAHLCPIL